MCRKKGYIELTFGCMFAGKTQELYRKICRLDVIKKEEEKLRKVTILRNLLVTFPHKLIDGKCREIIG